MKKKSNVPIIKKTPGVYNFVGTVDGKIVMKYSKLSKLDALNIFFNKIEDNIKNTTYTAEEIYAKYKEKWSKINFKSSYTDSYGHLWKDTFIPDHYVLDYLNNLINKLR